MTTLVVPAPSKLPVWSTVGASYAIVARNLGQLAHISWLWLLIMLPIYAAVYWLTWPLTREPPFQSFAGTVIGMLGNVIELPALASIAVAWHRLVLRGERMRRNFYLRLDRVVWGYALILFALLLLTLAAALRAVFLLPRVSLMLPALALGERLSLIQAWRATRGNTGPLFWATVLCTLPLYLPVLAALWYWDPKLDTQAPAVALGTIFSLTSVLVVTVGVTLQSIAYQHFVSPSVHRKRLRLDRGGQAGHPAPEYRSA